MAKSEILTELEKNLNIIEKPKTEVNKGQINRDTKPIITIFFSEK